MSFKGTLKYLPNFSRLVFSGHKMNKKSFGLDIGATSLKLVMLEGQGSAYILKAASISPVPAKGMLSESPLDEEEMAQAIAKAAKDAGITAKLVNVALPENQ